jgi:disulfide bond formation protein DsbB
MACFWFFDGRTVGLIVSQRQSNLASLETVLSVELLNQPRRVWLFIALVCVGLLSFGLYLQHVVGLEPCPMCIVQRYAMVLMGLIALLGAFVSARIPTLVVGGSLVLLAEGGAYVAARQSMLQWDPPVAVSCGRDFYGMIETFPLKQAIPMIFKGSGDCSKVDWTFLGGTIANWSFVAFLVLGTVALVTTLRVLRPQSMAVQASAADV